MSVAGRRNAIAAGSATVAQALPQLPPATRHLVELLASNHGPSPEDAASARSLAEAADEEYFALQEQGDDRSALARFSEARLLTALASGFGEPSAQECADAIYELCKATDDPAIVIHATEPAGA